MAEASLVNNAWFALGSSLVSGALAVVISTLYYRYFEKRKVKLDCIRRLLGARYVLTEGEHSAGAMETFYVALNEAVIIFSDAPAVISALQTLKAELRQNDRFEDNVVSIFRTMADELRLDRKTINDSFFLEPFKPQR